MHIACITLLRLTRTLDATAAFTLTRKQKSKKEKKRKPKRIYDSLLCYIIYYFTAYYLSLWAFSFHERRSFGRKGVTAYFLETWQQNDTAFSWDLWMLPSAFPPDKSGDLSLYIYLGHNLHLLGILFILSTLFCIFTTKKAHQKTGILAGLCNKSDSVAVS